MRPLDFLGRIKVKLGLAIVLAVGTAFVVNEVGLNSGISRDVRIAVALVLALIMVQVLAMGMTKPLREMARAAQTVAKGSYSLRVRATSRDEVGELARAFNAMAADLGEVDRQRRELVANVSHELRTPITGLRAILENVVDGVSAPDPVTMSTALAQTERLGRLVAQLLDLSRLDSGVRLIESEALELAPLLEQAVREAGLAREEVRLVPAVPDDLVVRADPDLLAQVLANLLDNAVRHSPPGGVVTVTGAPHGAGVRITVTDQGPGIPVSARGRVFERFSRLDAGRAADAGGAGLGLAIVKEIVEMHGGSIRIDDCAGCRMVVDLPGRTTMADSPLELDQQPGALPERPADAMSAEGEPAPAALHEQPGASTAETGSPPPIVEALPVGSAPAADGDQLGAVAQNDGAGMGASVAAPVPEPAPGERPEGAPVQVAHPHAVPAEVGHVHPSPQVEARPGSALARLVVGTVLGLIVGFMVGLFAAVFAGMTLGAGAALVTLVLCTALAGAIGAALGAGPGRRQANTSPYWPPVHRL
ncbi:ATP-binding protein [Nonomuraea sp. NPDC005983]|uniref:sensor histidine kinase n=1 Tax=Nonomuraea sp. NPDC005983 TaxID=3155595 RepID=UPI0033AB77C8